MTNPFEADQIFSSPLGQYARALLDVCEAEGVVQEILGQLVGCLQIVKKCPEVDLFLKNPTVSKEKKKIVLKQVAHHLACHPILTRFLEIMVDNQRLPHLEAIIHAYEHAIQKRKNISLVDVVSAQSLSAQEKKMVKTTIEPLFSGTLKVQFSIDPSLLGGLLIRSVDRVIDACVRSSLNQLAHAMKGNR